MSASNRCKELGLKSLLEASYISTFPKTTLYRMYNDEPKKFEAIALGCAAIKKHKENKRKV